MEAEDLEEYGPRFEECFAGLEKKINLLGQCQDSEKETIIRQGDNILNDLQQDINTYTAEIELLDHAASKVHRAQLKVYEANCDQLKVQFDTAKNKARNIGDELAALNVIGDDELQDRALALGDKMFEKSKKRAGNILNMIKESNALVNDINSEIKEQNARLLAMEDLIKDSQSHLKRASAQVDYFSSAFAKDCFMRVMIVLICIAIVGVIIFSVMSKTDTTAAATTTTTTTAAIKAGRRLDCVQMDGAYKTAANTSNGGNGCLELSGSLSNGSGIETPPGRPSQVNGPAPTNSNSSAARLLTITSSPAVSGTTNQNRLLSKQNIIKKEHANTNK